MKLLKLISITFTLFLICLIEIYLNTFISLNFGIYIFFITLVFLGVDFFSQNIAIAIFLSGILYDSFFSTYYLGLYSAIFIFVVIVANYLVSKYSKSNIIYFAIFSVCLLIYKLPIILEFDISYWLLSYIFSVIINFIVFMFFKRITRTNV
jgi:hypothetical protein